MDFDLLRLRASIAEELLAHLRGADLLLAGVPATRATWDTTFHGCYRVEIDHGPACRVAIEHVGGDGAFDWSMAELDRRRPATAHRADGPVDPPTPDQVRYRARLEEADPARARRLLETVLALDWGEPTPTSNAGRDGVVVSGAVETGDGARAWTSWSPQPATEPAKRAFFDAVARFAIDHGSGELRDDLALALA